VRREFKKVFEDRAYQFEVLNATLKCLQGKSNAAVTMPPGLGKNIPSAQVLSIFYGKALYGCHGKILLVLPGRLSLNLYTEHISWSRKFTNAAPNESEGI
jgi:ERCC4-related helicase